MIEESSYPEHKRLAFLALLTGLVALGPLSTDLYLPSLPMLARDFSVSAQEAQLTLSSFLSGFATAILVYGPLADRFGRRPVLLTGLSIYVAATGAMIGVDSINWLIALRFLQAMGSCAAAVVCRAMVRDVYGAKGAAKAMSILSAAVALAPAIGPILGGLIAEIAGWRGNFVALLIYGGIALGLSAHFLPETKPKDSIALFSLSSMVRIYRGLLVHRFYLGNVLAATFAYSGIFCFLSASSFVLIDVLGLSPRWFGPCFTVFVAGYITGAIGSAKMNARMGSMRLLGMGAGIAIFSAFLLVVWQWNGPNLIGLLVPLYFYMVGIGLALPNSQAQAIAPFPQSAGTASALLGFIQMALAASLGALLGYVSSLDALPMAITIFATTLGLGVSYLWLSRN